MCLWLAVLGQLIRLVNIRFVFQKKKNPEPLITEQFHIVSLAHTFFFFHAKLEWVMHLTVITSYVTQYA